MKVLLEGITVSSGTQVRERINEDVVENYAERMREGAEFPPVVLFSDGTQTVIGDGYHRVCAATREGFIDIEADVRTGTLQDALWYALGANASNAAQMTPQDKRHAVEMALRAFPAKTQAEIAEQVKCSQWLVSSTQKEFIANNKLTIPETRTGKDGKQYPTTKTRKPKEDTTQPEAPTQDEEQEQQATTTVETQEDDQKQENTQEIPGMAKKPKRTRAELAALPPKMGLQFARLAIMDLEKIQHNDTEKENAYNMVRSYIDEKQQR